MEYYISDWGGIKGNKPATLNEYSKKTANELILKKTDGISSWSKALVLSDPNKYAIYDARVAISINCLQLINKKNFKKVLFPLLIGKSRMSIIQKNAIDKQIKEIAKNENWECLDKATFYEEYLHILKTTNQALRKENIKTHGISTIEMLLFAETEELIKKAIKKNLLKELP